MPDEPAGPAAKPLRALRLVRRHVVFLLVLAAAVAIRVAAHVAYPFAFYFPDSGIYTALSTQWSPHQTRPIAYPVFLDPFVPGPLIRVAIAQHVIGVCLVVAGYAVLVRRGVRPWLAALAMVPLALDDMQVTLEHFVASETLFIALIGAALVLLLWWRRVPAVAAGVAGLLLAAATLTRTVGLPVVLAVLLFLLVKMAIGQAGWRAAAAYALAASAPLVAYVLWFHATHGVYAFEQIGGRGLYSRVMSIAECERLNLTERQRLLCVTTPPSTRPEAADYWGFSPNSPGNLYFPDLDEDPFLREFGMTVIRQQTWDYVRLVGRETSWHFRPRAPLSEPTLCRFGGWRFPEQPNTPCNAAYYALNPATQRLDLVPQPSTPLRSALAQYTEVSAAVRGPLLGVALLVALAVAVWRVARGAWRRSVDPVLVAAIGFGLTFASVALGMYEPRYGAPAIFLLPFAAALGLARAGEAKPDGRPDGPGQPRESAPAATTSATTQLPTPRSSAGPTAPLLSPGPAGPVHPMLEPSPGEGSNAAGEPYVPPYRTLGP